MGKTSKSAWTRAESSAAALFGAMRRVLSGSANRADIDGDDSTHPRLFIESKLRASWSVRTLWEGTKRAAQKCARPGGKTPVLVLRQKNKIGALIVVHSADFAEVAAEFLAARDDAYLEAFEAKVRVRRCKDADAIEDRG